MEEDQLRDYAVERNSADNLVGNVYRARVCNVVPGIQAAFVDLNTGKNGFLTLKKGETLSEGQMLLVQVVKDARGSKGPAVTRDITLPGRQPGEPVPEDQLQNQAEGTPGLGPGTAAGPHGSGAADGSRPCGGR